ncbi:MAG: hypothetical protein ACRCX4_05855 [Bacteroidales bacterium]
MRQIIFRYLPKSILTLAVILTAGSLFSCKNDSDLKSVYGKCFLFKDARKIVKIKKDTTLVFPIESLSSLGERTTTFTLVDSLTKGKDGINFEVPKEYTFAPGETKGEIKILMKYIDSDSLVRVVLDLKTDNCISYVEDSALISDSYKSIKINCQSIQE